MPDCPHCSFTETARPGGFCVRCGGRRAHATPADRLEFRLSVIRRVVRNRCWRHESIGGQLKRQVEDAGTLLSQTGAGGGSLTQLASDLLSLEGETDIVALLRLLNACLVFDVSGAGESDVASWSSVRRLGRSRAAVRDGILDVESRLRNGKLAEKRVGSAFARLVKKLDVTESFVEECVRTAPVNWPRTASALAPEMHAAIVRDHTVVRCRKAVREQNLGIARQKLEGVLSEDPHHVAALECLASALRKGGEERAFLETSWRAVRAGTNNPLTLNNLAWFTCTSGTASEEDVAAVLPLAVRAAELLPTSTQRDTLAEVLERLGRLEEAIAETREALRDEPEKGTVLERMRRLCSAWDERFGGSVDQLAGEPSATPAAPPDSGFELDFSDDDALEMADDSVGSDASVVVEFDDEEDFSLEVAAPADDSDVALDLGDEVFDDLADVVVSGSAIDAGAPAVALDDDEPDEQSAAGTSTARGEVTAEDTAEWDPVDCTVHAPPSACPGDAILVQVFAHLAEQAEEVEARARRVDSDARWRNATSLGTRIARGSRLDFELRTKHLDVDEPEQSLVWNGNASSVEFEVEVPESLSPRKTTGTVIVSQDGIPIGRIRFTLEVAGTKDAAAEQPVTTGEATRYRTAFASYASQDRAEVLRRVQMLRTLGIQCFQDVLDLEPGDRWERELYRRIDESDVVFLFWSTAARDSEWVTREWKYALETRGDDVIVPVVIEGPPPVPPARELEHLHFNDRILYVMGLS